jgi:GxxExxY protein
MNSKNMNAEELNRISGIIVDRALHIHKELGPGLLERVYHRILAYELRKSGFDVQIEAAVPVIWDGMVLEDSFRADLIINSAVLVELKSVAALVDVHKKQTLTYLKLTELQLGLLINFGEKLLKDGIVRIVNGFPG